MGKSKNSSRAWSITFQSKVEGSRKVESRRGKVSRITSPVSDRLPETEMPFVIKNPVRGAQSKTFFVRRLREMSAFFTMAPNHIVFGLIRAEPLQHWKNPRNAAGEEFHD